MVQPLALVQVAAHRCARLAAAGAERLRVRVRVRLRVRVSVKVRVRVRVRVADPPTAFTRSTKPGGCSFE